MADEIVASEGRGKWTRVSDDLNDTSYIVNPAGTEYEISASRMAQIDRDLAVLLNDMLDSLFDLQNESEALRARDALRDRAEGQAAFDVVAQLEAAKAERAADKAGFEVVIRELRAEVARLKSSAPVAAPVRLTDGDMLDSLNETAIAKQAACGYPSMRNLLDMARAIESAALRANGFKVEGEK